MSSIFSLPSSTMIEPRPYQTEALNALDNHLETKTTNPCVVIPTGGGKSILMAWSIQRWKLDYPALRVCVLAHRQELVEQNAAEMMQLWPGGDVGVYAAGLRRRDTRHSILYASIDSIWEKGGELEPFDVAIVDEAHRIPPKGEGKYRDFLKMLTLGNKNIRTVGFTATPFRMGCGNICHRDHILNEICYEANVADLIHEGYLCRLRSKISDHQPDLTDVRRNHGGDYVTASLAQAVDKKDVVSAAINETVKIIEAEGRKSVIFFCVDVEHCKRVSNELRIYGIDAPYVTANTAQHQRERIANDFKAGHYRALCNVNVYTEGFNAKQVDSIVLLRPTLSKGMYAQMVGRGLRLHPQKTDCLVLDFANCIDTHGPVDCIGDTEVKMARCGGCGDSFSRAVRVCPHCGWVIPKEDVERMESEEREKKLHEAKHSNRSILSGEPETLTVDHVTIHRHIKQGSPDSLRVEYRCGLRVIKEWVCLDHEGPAGNKGRHWWRQRFGEPIPTIAEALTNMFLPNMILSTTASITVKRSGKYDEIIGHDLSKATNEQRTA